MRSDPVCRDRLHGVLADRRHEVKSQGAAGVDPRRAATPTGSTRRPATDSCTMIQETANVRRHSYRYQRTISRPAELTGIGFLTGASVRLRFRPAPPSTGVVFLRTDLSPLQQIPARVHKVTATQRRTTLGRGPAPRALVEHVLAALAALRIDNCFVDINAPEPPGFDASAQRLVETLRQAVVVLHAARTT